MPYDGNRQIISVVLSFFSLPVIYIFHSKVQPQGILYKLQQSSAGYFTKNVLALSRVFLVEH